VGTLNLVLKTKFALGNPQYEWGEISSQYVSSTSISIGGDTLGLSSSRKRKGGMT